MRAVPSGETRAAGREETAGCAEGRVVRLDQAEVQLVVLRQHDKKTRLQADEALGAHHGVQDRLLLPGLRPAGQLADPPQPSP